MNPFDFINAITQTKEDLFKDPQASKDYNAFMVNRGLSQYPDTILYANEMNMHYNLDSDMQFKYLINTITKKKRFSKWAKKDKDSKSFLLVKEYFKYSDEKARQALDILTSDQLAIIEQKLYKGGY
ncbi:clamp loader small subunit [uncultured Caudovirales phage]|uniref:Clamp loader small subunit n=1 Tax=uncultured Caudovirales phage TaxID=2100421 RepID=A0A6J5L3Y2_9CAUD|nr:clamp loader small subunit [uncultured Caudovirales phage]